VDCRENTAFSFSFFAMGISLPSHCLAMDIIFTSSIPAVGHHVTVLYFKCKNEAMKEIAELQ
jgi:hypothetical protein